MLVKALYQQIDIATYHGLLLLHTAFRKVVRDPFPQLSVLLRPCVEEADGPFGCLPVVFIGLLKLAPAAGAINVLPRAAVDEAHIIQPKSDHWAVHFEQILGVVRELALQACKYKGQICDAIDERPRVAVQRVEEQPVDCYISNIKSNLILQCQNSEMSVSVYQGRATYRQ